MEDSPKDNDDCKNTFQDESEKSSTDTTTLGNQVLLSVQQETLENQQLPSGISSETPLPSVPTPTSTSQTLNSAELDEIFSNKDVFYSSRRLRICTKCSRGVDAVLTNRQHLTACKYCSQESGGNIAALGSQLLPSLGQETSENRQVPPGISSETFSRPSVSTISSSSPSQDITPLDETSSNDDAFYSSRDLRIRLSYSRSVDAVLSPRQTHLGRVVRLPSRQNLSTSFLPILEKSDAFSAENEQRDQSPLGECHDIESSQLSTVLTTRSLSEAPRQKAPTPSPEKWSVEKGARSISAKRKRTQSPESESDQWRATLEPYVPKASPSVLTREMRSVAREDEVPESLTRSETPKKRKTEIMESGSCDSNLAHDPLESYSNFPTSVSIIGLESPTNLQTQEITAVDRDRIESVIEDKTSISSLDYSAVPDLILRHSNPVDTNLATSFDDLLMEEYETAAPSNASTGISLGGSNEDSRKRRRSSDSITVISLPSAEETGSASAEETGSASAEETGSASAEETGSASAEELGSASAEELGSASAEETGSASNTAHSATKIQMLESSHFRPIIENPVIPLPRGIFAGTEEARGVITSPSSNAFSSSHSSKQSSSANIKAPRQDLEFLTNKAKEGTDKNRSNSSTSTSKQNTESTELTPTSPSRMRQQLLNVEVRQAFNSSEKNRNDPLLQRQHLDSISNEASRARERSEVGMDLNAPYIDVLEGQPSTSSYQPVTAAGSASNRFSSSSVTASGEERGEAIKSNTSANRISKYISNARKLLLTVLEEIMKIREEKCVYRIFSKLFLRVSVLSYPILECSLSTRLMAYVDKRFQEENELQSFPIAEHDALEVFDILRRIVVASLVSTLLNHNFDFMIINYKNLKVLCEKSSQFWRDDNEGIEDEDSRLKVAFLKKITQRLVLQTRNAFRELLVYIGENAADKIVDSYEKYLWEEDKSFLRRQLL